MENRIKEQQLCLFADRTSCATMRANQLRLWLSSAAYFYNIIFAERGLGVLPAIFCDARLWPACCGRGGSSPGPQRPSETVAGG
ncbi:MAG: transposase, partial [Planctomycetia bacterium]|nr:transposase [Planctomycetia bacterium]